MRTPLRLYQSLQRFYLCRQCSTQPGACRQSGGSLQSTPSTCDRRPHWHVRRSAISPRVAACRSSLGGRTKKDPRRQHSASSFSLLVSPLHRIPHSHLQRNPSHPTLFLLLHLSSRLHLPGHDAHRRNRKGHPQHRSKLNIRVARQLLLPPLLPLGLSSFVERVPQAPRIARYRLAQA